MSILIFSSIEPTCVLVRLFFRTIKQSEGFVFDVDFDKFKHSNVLFIEGNYSSTKVTKLLRRVFDVIQSKLEVSKNFLFIGDFSQF